SNSRRSSPSTTSSTKNTGSEGSSASPTNPGSSCPCRGSYALNWISSPMPRILRGHGQSWVTLLESRGPRGTTRMGAAYDTGTEELLVRVEARVAVVTLNRPEARNALTPAMKEALARTIPALGADPEVGC